MKLLTGLLLSVLLISAPEWHHNLDEARQIAQKEHRFIVLNFSGSDWCGPCIRMHKEIFASEAFTNLAANKLVLVNADFPRLKRNQLSKGQQTINDALADKYNPNGKFPYTVLLDQDGKVIKDWEGFTGNKPEEFCNQLSTLIGAR